MNKIAWTMMVVGLLSNAVAAAEWRANTQYPPLKPEQIEPLTGIGPAVMSPITAEQRKAILQYGGFFMIRGVENKDSAQDDAIYKDMGFSIVSHSGHHRGALPWNNRPKTLASMLDTSRSNRLNIAATHRLGMLVLSYTDYQRWFADTHHAEWTQQRVIWKHLLGDAPADDAAFLMRYKDGKIAGAGGGLYSMGAPAKSKDARVILCLNAPTTLNRAKGSIAIDVANGCDGSYFDCGGFSAGTCYCDLCRAAWQDWLAKKLTPEQRKDLLGAADPAKIELPALRGKAAGSALDPQRPHVPPVQIAFARFQVDVTTWFRKEIKAYGRSLNPGYVMASTCWASDGRPSWWNSPFEFWIGPEGDDFLFWEPDGSGPAVGRTEETEKKAAAEAAAKDAKKAGQPLDYRWGRRSYAPALRYLQTMAAVGGVPPVSKMAPSKGAGDQEKERLTELLMAEEYANLCSARVGYGGTFSPEAVKRMIRIQSAHPDYFTGSRPYAPVAVHVSFAQGLINRTDASCSFIRFLDDLGVDCQVILDRQITEEGLKPFDCVVLPATDMLSEAQMKALEAYRKTGRLIVFGSAGTRDEWDRDRPDGLKRLVGDLALDAAGKQTKVAADGRVAFMPAGVCENFPLNMWYRRARDCNMDELRKAVTGTLGKAWPYLAAPSQTRLIHLARIERAAGARLTAHIVNYDTAKPMEAFPLEIQLYGGLKATAASFIKSDAPEASVKLAVETVMREGRPYAKVTVPAIPVYGVVAIDCDGK